jgi:Flp pilus assembly protein TadD/TolB-like protein
MTRLRWLLIVAMCALPQAAAAQSLVPVGARQLVMPFENVTGEPRGYWLSEGSAVLLTDSLNRLGAQAITREARLSAFEQLRVPPVASLSHATEIRIGQAVGAAQVVVGSFELVGDELVVHARALRLDTGRLFPEIVDRAPLLDVFALYERVGRRLLPDARIGTPPQAPPPFAAFEQYVKGVLAESSPAKIAFLTEALRLAPDFQRPRVALWSVYTDQGAHRQALDVVSKVPDGRAQTRRARFLGALSLIQLAEYQRAFETLTELNRLAPDPALLNNLGVVQLRRPASTPPAEKPMFYFAQAARSDQRDGDLFFNLGYASFLERDTQGAITALREAVRRNPADGAAHYVLAVALQSSGRTAEATREKELARQLSSMSAQWETRQTGSAVPRGLERVKATLEGDEARTDDVIVATGQRDQREVAAFHLASGRRLFEAQRDAEAIAELRRAIFLSPYESEAHLLLGRAYLRGGRVDAAIDALKISLWSADTIPAHLALAEGYIRSKMPTEARAQLQTVLAVDANNAEARRLLATIPTP